MNISVRAARIYDGPAQQHIEIAAGRQFERVGMPDVANDEPASLTLLARYASEGRAWSAVDEEDRPIGYVLVSLVDGQAHIDQVSVSPKEQGRGIGRALIDQVATWALGGGMTALTLTTFSEVPWNKPLYEHLGFRVLDETEVGPGLRALREREARLGLDSTLRVCMRRDLG